MGLDGFNMESFYGFIEVRNQGANWPIGEIRNPSGKRAAVRALQIFKLLDADSFDAADGCRRLQRLERGGEQSAVAPCAPPSILAVRT